MGSIETQGYLANQSKMNSFTLVTSDYTVTTNDTFLAVNCSNGAITLTLPTAFIATDNNTNQVYSPSYAVKKIDNTNNSVNILASNMETIDGNPSFVLNDSQESIELISDGNNWLVY